MPTENFAQSMQQKRVAASEQGTQAEELGLMTGELEDSELETVAGGIQSITIDGPTPSYATNLLKNGESVVSKYAKLFQSSAWKW